MEKTQVNCPHCGEAFDLEDALSGKLEEHFKNLYQEKLNTQLKKLNQEKEELAKMKEKQEELVKSELEKLLNVEKQKLESSLLEKFEHKLKILEEENKSEKQKNREFQVKEIELLKKEKELKEKQEDMKLQIEKELLEKESEIKSKAIKQEQEKFELEKLKWQKQIEDHKKLAEEMKRKAEQGSMQLQGEIQELAIEDFLKSNFPFDIIEEVPKGIRGADCIQTVINELQQSCGKIVFESKRTKAFSDEWITKLKNDQIICKAEIAVLITETMPKDLDKFGQKDGVWVCSFSEFKSLTTVLREILIKTNAVKETQVNKGDKMELLYSFLTSPEFIQHVKRVVETYDDMLSQLNKEKSAMTKIWGQREKQIWIIQENLSSIFGKIKAIGGNSLPQNDLFKLEEPEKED